MHSSGRTDRPVRDDMAARHIATKAMKPHLYYMSAWFCPFAHRATLALEHHSSHLTWEWIEALGWEKRRATDESLQTEHENWYHFKAPELMKHNPLGMVPTLVSEATFTGDASKDLPSPRSGSRSWPSSSSTSSSGAGTCP